MDMPMTLETSLARFHTNRFLREFTFAKNTFSPMPGELFELADHVVAVHHSVILSSALFGRGTSDLGFLPRRFGGTKGGGATR